MDNYYILIPDGYSRRNHNLIRRVNLRIPEELESSYDPGLYVRMVLHHQEKFLNPCVSLYITGGNGSAMRNKVFWIGNLELELLHEDEVKRLARSYGAAKVKEAVEGKLADLLTSALPEYKRLYPGQNMTPCQDIPVDGADSLL